MNGGMMWYIFGKQDELQDGIKSLVVMEMKSTHKL